MTTTTTPGVLPSYVVPALNSGTSWIQIDPSNVNPTNITYTYWNATPVYDTDPSENSQFEAFTPTMVAAVEACHTYLSNIANVTFSQVTDPGRSDEAGQAAIQVGYGMANIDPSAEAYTYYPDPTDPNVGEGGDVWANVVYFNENAQGVSDGTAHVVPDDYDWMTLWHETGHALGLKHPFNDGSGDPPFFLPRSVNSDQYSIMSYTHSTHYEYKDLSGHIHDVYPETYMPDDIAAIQAIYGANTTYNTGDDTYDLSQYADHVETIWDAGGNDTLDGSGLTTNETINLTPGGYSTINNDDHLTQLTEISQNFAIAYGAVIENVTTGSGNDTVYDNSADNNIQTGAGNDTIWLSTGNDTVGAGDDNDIIHAGAGNESIDGGNGTDTVFFAGASTGYVGDGSGQNLMDTSGHTYTLLNDETLKFTDGTFNGATALADQTLTGGVLADKLYGGLGNDVISGGAGNDTLYGYSGDDTLDGGPGSDVMYGGAGNDTYFVDSTSDHCIDISGVNGGIDTVISSVTYTLGAYLENLTLTGSANINGTGNSLNNVIIGNSGNNLLNGSSGNDTLDAGTGLDTLTGGTGADTFHFQAGQAGVDSVKDFHLTQGDVIDISNVLTNDGYAGGSLANWVEFTVGATSTTTVMSIDATGTGTAFAAVATLTGVTAATLPSADVLENTYHQLIA